MRPGCLITHNYQCRRRGTYYTRNNKGKGPIYIKGLGIGALCRICVFLLTLRTLYGGVREKCSLPAHSTRLLQMFVIIICTVNRFFQQRRCNCGTVHVKYLRFPFFFYGKLSFSFCYSFCQRFHPCENRYSTNTHKIFHYTYLTPL